MHLEKIRAAIQDALPAMAGKHDPEVEDALERAETTGRNDRLVRVANLINRRFIHDLVVRYIGELVGGIIDDTSHHDLVLRTIRGGHIFLEIKCVAMRGGKGWIHNKQGDPMRVTLVAVVADPESESGLEILILPAASIRAHLSRTLRPDGEQGDGWGISVTRSKLAMWRELRQLLPFDEGMEQVRKLAVPGRS